MKRTLYVGCLFSACRGAKPEEQSRISEKVKNDFIEVPQVNHPVRKMRGDPLVLHRMGFKLTCNSLVNAG